MCSLSFRFISDIYERHLVYKAPFWHRERNVMTFGDPVSKDCIFLVGEMDLSTGRQSEVSGLLDGWERRCAGRGGCF